MATQIEVDEEGIEYPLHIESDATVDLIIEKISGGITMLDKLNGEVIQGHFITKLKMAIATKMAIAEAIKDTGLDLPDDTRFADYPQYIALINTEQPIIEGINELADQLLNLLGISEEEETIEV